jgi:hypothetical protein
MSRSQDECQDDATQVWSFLRFNEWGEVSSSSWDRQNGTEFILW